MNMNIHRSRRWEHWMYRRNTCAHSVMLPMYVYGVIGKHRTLFHWLCRSHKCVLRVYYTNTKRLKKRCGVSQLDTTKLRSQQILDGFVSVRDDTPYYALRQVRRVQCVSTYSFRAWPSMSAYMCVCYARSFCANLKSNRTHAAGGRMFVDVLRIESFSHCLVAISHKHNQRAVVLVRQCIMWNGKSEFLSAHKWIVSHWIWCSAGVFLLRSFVYIETIEWNAKWMSFEGVSFQRCDIHWYE